MRKINTYIIKSLASETIDLPVGSVILTAQDLNGVPTLFVSIDIDEQKTEPRIVYMVETWKPVEAEILDKIKIGSFTIANYGKVYHFFAEPLKNEFPKNSAPPPVKREVKPAPPNADLGEPKPDKTEKPKAEE